MAELQRARLDELDAGKLPVAIDVQTVESRLRTASRPQTPNCPDPAG
jgi:hypothetical protein